MSFGEALESWNDIVKERVREEIWGHLAPQPQRYNGEMLFTLSEYGDFCLIRANFPALEDSPWLFEDMNNFIVEKATKRGGIYTWSGVYTKFKNGGSRFSGKTNEVIV